MKKLFVSLAPYLNKKGHDWSYQQNLMEVADLQGWEFIGLGPIGCDVSLPSHWHEWFLHRREKIKAFFYSFPDFFRCIKHVSKREEQVVFFIEKFYILDYLPLCIIFSLFLPKKDLLCILFRHEKNRFPFCDKLQTWFTKAMVAFLGNRVKFFSDSDLIARDLAERYNKGFEVLPIPHTDGVITSLSKQSYKGYLKMWWPGEPRATKGLQEIRQIISSNPADKEVKLAVSEEAHLPWGLSTISLEKLPPVLDRKSYDEMMLHSDIVLLPYDPHLYKYSTSGILVEAIIAGKTPFVREGSWLAYELRKHQLDELIIDWGKEDTLHRVLGTFYSTEVQSKISKMRENYIQYHSMREFNAKFASALD